jgi:hypothetical protein
MKITLDTSSYNERRFGKPWIAIVTFDKDVKGTFTWGDWVGDHHNGSDGTLVIDADEGDIIAIGQKDFRKPANSALEWYQVRNGELVRLTNKAEAYKLATS